MAIPLIYNIRSVRVRLASTAVAVFGISGVVAVFIAMLSMANGFWETLKSTGSPKNVMVRRGGSNSELESAVQLDQVKLISDTAGIAKNEKGKPLVSPEVVVIAALPMISTGTDANVQVRGVSEIVFEVRPNVRLAQGRMFQPGLNELIVGANAVNLYAGISLGSEVKIGRNFFKVVGLFDGGGSAFDSEIWCDTVILNQTFNRPQNIFQSVTVRLESEQGYAAFQDLLAGDPSLTVKTEKEVDYYERQSRMITTFIRVLGFLVASIMGIGAVFGALNTMFASVSSRSREIATLRSIGFTQRDVIISFVFESIFIAFLGGCIGCLVALPLNGFTASTINWSTFSHLAFAFKVTPGMLGSGLVFAVFMGFLGGFFPAVRAARQSIPMALRGL